MRVDLLNRLGDHLVNLTCKTGSQQGKATFNMEHWQQTVDCGFSGCAMGYAANMPSFKDEGLIVIVNPEKQDTRWQEMYAKLKPYEHGGCSCGISGCNRGQNLLAELLEDATEREIAYEKDGKLLTRYEAAAALFDITVDEANYLFNPERYTAEQRLDAAYVGRRIQRFAQKKLDLVEQAIENYVRDEPVEANYSEDERREIIEDMLAMKEVVYERVSFVK